MTARDRWTRATTTKMHTPTTCMVVGGVHIACANVFVADYGLAFFWFFFSFHFIGFHLVDSQIHTRKKNWISSTQTTAHNNRNYISSEAKRAWWWRTKYTTSKNVSIEWARTCLISVKVSNSFRNLSRICKSRNYCFNEANNHDHPT